MGSGARRATAALLALFAVTAWIVYGVLRGLPRADASGRSVLYLAYGHSSTWWSLVAFSVAAATSYALLVWMLWVLTLRTGSRRRGWTSIAAAFLAMASGGALAFVGGATVLLVAVEGKQTVVEGADGTAAAITVDAFDGDIVLVWRRVARFAYEREQGRTTIDPRSGACSVLQRASIAVLTCGTTSQVL